LFALNTNAKVNHMSSKSQGKTKPVDVPLRPLRPRKRPRGNHDHEAFRANQFKKGESGHPGGKPQVMVRFSAKIAEAMLEPATPAVRKALQLKRGASTFDAVIAATIAQATSGETSAFVALRESLEGKLPQTTKNLNVSVSMQRFLEDPQFREFLDKQHAEFLKLSGEDFTDGYPRATIEEDVQSLPAGNNADGV
jgi:hypothetical protein